MISQPSDTDPWQDCAPGTLNAYRSRESGRLLRRKVTYLGGAVATGCLLMAVAYFANLSGAGFNSGSVPESLPHLGGLACREVMHEMDNFFADDLDADYRAQVLKHLHDCPKCDKKYQKRADALGVQVAQLQSTSGAEAWSPVLAFQPYQPTIGTVQAILSERP